MVVTEETQENCQSSTF